jgi:hypothetical protein
MSVPVRRTTCYYVLEDYNLDPTTIRNLNLTFYYIVCFLFVFFVVYMYMFVEDGNRN